MLAMMLRLIEIRAFAIMMQLLIYLFSYGLGSLLLPLNVIM